MAPAAPNKSREVDQSIVALPTASIQASLTNPRHDFGDIDELAASLAAYGLLQPVVVRPRARGYDLIAGHRRLAAAQKLGWETIPAIVRKDKKAHSDILQMVENLQRKDLSPEEEAAGLGGLMRRYKWTTREVAHAIKRSQAYVSKRVRVYDDADLRKAVIEGGLAPSTAEELLSVAPERRALLADLAVQQGWGVAEVRDSVRSDHMPQVSDQVGASSTTSRRPRGFTTMVKTLRGILRLLLPRDLSEADRRELRLLFIDLAFLAKGDPARREVVFPPLPVAPTRRRAS